MLPFCENVTDSYARPLFRFQNPHIKKIVQIYRFYGHGSRIRGFYPAKRTHASSGYPSSAYLKKLNPSYGRLFDKAMNYRNPMDLSHNPKDVELFKPRFNYDHSQPLIKKKTWEVPESEEEYLEDPDPFFKDIPKINIANAIDSRSAPGPGLQSERLQRFPSPDIEQALEHAPEQRQGKTFWY